MEMEFAPRDRALRDFLVNSPAPSSLIQFFQGCQQSAGFQEIPALTNNRFPFTT